MKKLTIILVLLSAFTFLFGQSLNRPESIIYDAAHGRYLISNYGNGNNGSILAYDPIEDVYSNFNTAHSIGPKGLAIFENTLYVSESGFINGFNLDTGQRTFNKQVATAWINDLTVDEQGNLYTGESNTGKIYKINTNNGQVEEWISGGLEDINGLLVDQENNRLLAVFYKLNSPIMAFDLETAEATTLTETSYSNFDGITVDNCGKYYVSSQSSRMVFSFDESFSNPPVVAIEGLLKPADIFFNKDMDVLCIPEIDDNQIVFVPIFRTCQAPLLIEPENNKTAVTGTNTPFSWEPIRDVDYYRFELAEDSAFSKIVIVDGTGSPEFIVESLEPSTKYYWRVNAYKQNQHTEYSETWSFTTESSSRIELRELKDQCQLFPNPATESISLCWGDKAPELLQLYTSTGQKVLEFNSFSQTSSSSQSICLEGLSPGSYFCVVTMQDSKLWVKNLIVN